MARLRLRAAPEPAPRAVGAVGAAVDLAPGGTPPLALAAPPDAGAPGRDPAVWRAIGDFVFAKGGDMRPHYALLCVVYWLQFEHGCDTVAAADVKAIMPRLGDVVAGRLRSPADTLRRARDERLVDALGNGRYRLTRLGAAVVDALPDAAQVGAIRGAQRAHCRRRTPGPPGDAAGHA